MAGTSQLLDIHQRDFSPEIPQATHRAPPVPAYREAGAPIGTLQTETRGQLLGLPAGCW